MVTECKHLLPKKPFRIICFGMDNITPVTNKDKLTGSNVVWLCKLCEFKYNVIG